MIIDVTVASSDPQLCTTAEVKQLLGTTSTADDAMIDAMITVASKWAESFVGYPLSAQRYQQLVPAYGTRNLTLARMPLRSIVNGPFTATDTGTADELDSTEFRVNRAAAMLDRDEGWAWTAPLIPHPFGFGLTQDMWAGQERPSWFVDYVAGYTYGGISTGSSLWSTRSGTTSTGRTLPQDVSNAVALKAMALYEGSEGIAEKAVGDLRIRYGSYGADVTMPDPPERLLMPYQRMV